MEFLEAKPNKTKQNKIKTNKQTEIKESKKLYQTARQKEKQINLTLDYGGEIEHFEGKTKQKKKKKKTRKPHPLVRLKKQINHPP